MRSLSTAGASLNDKIVFYARLHEDVKAIVEGERDWIANTANCAVLLSFSAGRQLGRLLFLKGKDLVLGPFQGKPACVRIGPGRGVCGAAVAKRQTLVVPNVHEFPGHVACDSASNSEIVLPLLSRGRILGVLDINSPLTHRFDADDAAGLEAVVTSLLAVSDVTGEVG